MENEMEKKKKKADAPRPEFKPRLVSADSTGKLIWNVGDKEETWFIDGMNVDEIIETARLRPKEAYNKSKKWKLKID